VSVEENGFREERERWVRERMIAEAARDIAFGRKFYRPTMRPGAAAVTACRDDRMIQIKDRGLR
jgi:hypothetical protein